MRTQQSADLLAPTPLIPVLANPVGVFHLFQWRRPLTRPLTRPPAGRLVRGPAGRVCLVEVEAVGGQRGACSR